ncbi:DMT family transporter [Planctomycetota bacterium]
MKTHNTNRKIDSIGTLACLGVVVFWSWGPIFIKYLTGYIDAWTQNLLRYTAACLFLLPALLYSINKNTFDKRLWLKALAPAAANLTMQSLYACGFYYIGAGFMILLTKSAILWVAAFSLIFFPQERPLAKSKRFWLGLLLSAGGLIGVMYFKEGFITDGTITGIFFALSMAFMMAVYTISVRIAFRNIDSKDSFSVISIYTVGGFLILTLIFGNPESSLQMGIKPWASIIFSGVTSIAMGHIFFYVSIKHIGATIPGLLTLSQPFFVIAISFFLFSESLNTLQLIFGAILLAGSAMAVLAQQHLKSNQ